MEPQEQELVKGLIYVTDFRKPNKSQKEQIERFESEFYETFASTTETVITDDTDKILLELKELQIKSFHLDRSNREIKELDPSWESDTILVDAIIENTSIINRYKNRMEYLKQTLHARHALPANFESQIQALQEHILHKQEQIHQHQEKHGIESPEEEMRDTMQELSEQTTSTSVPAFAQQMEDDAEDDEIYL